MRATETTAAGTAPQRRAQIEWVPLESVRLNPENPRLNEPAVEPVMHSIARFGFRVPLVVNGRTGLVEAGHTRWKAAQRMGLAEIPVIFADDDEVTALAFALADNRTAEIATWDEPALAGLLQRLAREDQLTASGFSDDDLTGLLAKLEAEDASGREETWEAPAEVPRGPTRVQPGELWQLGRHRVMCGDSTDSSAMARLMRGDVARLVATDPPYGVSYDGNAHRREHGGGIIYRSIANDDLDPVQLEAFLTDAFSAALPHVADDAAWYVWHASTTRPVFLAALSAVGVTMHQEIVWIKESFQLSRSDYHWQHEPCLYGWRDRHVFRGERNQSTVWQIPRQSDHQHPTTKPLELWERPVRNHLEFGEVVLDPFLGSGTAACARGMEIDPRYCDVALQRWEQFTGESGAKIDG